LLQLLASISTNSSSVLDTEVIYCHVLNHVHDFKESKTQATASHSTLFRPGLTISFLETQLAIYSYVVVKAKGGASQLQIPSHTAAAEDDQELQLVTSPATPFPQ
jgi:hypothetical protein